MKSSQKFDYRRFADALVERGLIDYETVEHVVTQCEAAGGLMTEVLVNEDLVSDWEVARVACELYHLPFLTVDCYPPSASGLEGLDADFLRQYALVPADRFGKVLSIIMPGLVPSAVLDALTFDGTRVLPLVGSVSSNRRWLNEHLAASGPVGLEAISAPLPAGDWASIFDAGDQAVQLQLNEKDGSLEFGLLDELDDILGDPAEEPAAAAKSGGAKSGGGSKKKSDGKGLRLKGESDDE